MRGFEAERDLARRLWQKGFAVIRAPASGAKTKHYVYPDL
ncbi:MAG TPA: Holliday junction resolvase, partial [Pyrodictiaceae archaeon]|nr:Holliday junction resolvase [Pyrodictiaceae archaeon]